MLTVINNTRMRAVATVADLETALAWAETVPVQNDFSVVAHTLQDLSPYSSMELCKFYAHLQNRVGTIPVIGKPAITEKCIEALNSRQITSELPPDEKRVALLNEDNDMATKKAPTKKAAAKKAPAKKAPAKVAPAKAAKKVDDRVRQNGKLPPKPGSVREVVWGTADALSKKAGEPAKRADVVAACVEAGVKQTTASGMYQGWRKYHGLVGKGA